MRLLLLFILVPFIELFILVKISGMIGFWTTVFIIIITGMIGVSMMRWQGLKTLQLIEADLNQGKMPADRILSGLLILLGGAFLITPGIITDLAGLALMVPGNRRLLLKYLKSRIKWQFEHGQNGRVFFFHTGGPGGGNPFEQNRPGIKNGQSIAGTDRKSSGGADET
ncbi:MAG: FxsA family protein [Planctomycetes bacterium]|nr:FxsA family protein [Planctomycetota bacterium]